MSFDTQMANNNRLALRVENLGKMYTLYERPVDRLKHSLLWRAGKDYGHEFWALRGISFDIMKGETFGIIGRNGSGKSTLLQILAGTLHHTIGQVTINGRITALLELGSGFNPEFTGRENVLLNGMILGISRDEMLARFEQIAAFADIGEFIDQPVKLYSSGMFVRLAFAVVANLDAEILLVDEALAVGDIFFRQKCYQRLSALRSRGVSIILVSHSMNEIEQFCERALLLHAGQKRFLGPAIEAVKRYYVLQQLHETQQILRQPAENREPTILSGEQTGIHWPEDDAFLDISALPQVSADLASCTAVGVTDDQRRPCLVFQQGEMAHFFYEFETKVDIEIPIGGAEIVNDKGTIVHGKNSLLYGSNVPGIVPKGNRVRFEQQIKLEVHNGEYTFNIGFSTISRHDYSLRAEYPHAELDAKITVLCILPNAGQFAVVSRPPTEPSQLTHFGVANLPGMCQVDVLTPGACLDQ